MKQVTNKKVSSVFNQFRLRRLSFTGIMIGIVAFVTCELPIILALVGLGGFSASVEFLKPPAILETIGLVLLLAGVVLLIVLAIKNRLVNSAKGN